MDVYLAARFGRRLELRTFAALLFDAGINVTSRWIHNEHDELVTPGSEAAHAYFDLGDLRRAQVCVSFTEDPAAEAPGRARGGRHVEFGVALEGRRHLLILVGPRENVFHYVDDVLQFDTAAEALEYLVEKHRQQRQREGW